MMLPRLLLLGLYRFSLRHAAVKLEWSFKCLFCWASYFHVCSGIPGDLDNKALEKAIKKVPVLFILMFINLFRLRGAHKKFIHTSHGEN